MPFYDVYRRQAALLVRIMPHVAAENCFALKGGTAINLFIRDMPRISVDIDLTYLPFSTRQESLADIHAAMKRIAQGIRRVLHSVTISASETAPEKRRQSRSHLKITAVTA
jgi:predicted nucleotidyltransferase component of viral defense system